MIKLTIVGYGYVGKAVEHAFQQIANLHIVDPQYNNNQTKDVAADGVIVCVGTPANSDGTCNSSAIFQVFEEIPENVPVMIKSTIALENFLQLQQQFPHHEITLSPEFLRGNHAIDDFESQQYVILGGGNVEFWKNVFDKRFSQIKHYVCTHQEAILIKYAENSFLAVKVGFFNHLHDLSKLFDADFETVRHLLTRDSRIGEDHSFVPGPDGMIGWGGHCLPKDTSAILHTAQTKFGYSFDILEAACKYNSIIRS